WIHHAPLLRLLPPFLVGILFQIRFPVLPGWIYVVLPVLIFLLGVANTCRFTKRSVHNPIAYSAILYLLLFLTGCSITRLHTDSLHPNHISRLPEQEYLMIVRIDAPPVEKEKSFKAMGEIRQIRTPSGWIHVQGKLLCRFAKSTQAKTLRYGDLLLIRTFLSTLPGPMNPGMFDYKEYLNNRQVTRQCFAGSAQYIRLERAQGNPVVQRCETWRKNLINWICPSGINHSDAGVGEALILGYEDELDPDLLNAYSGSGVLHILSVSGMHVALVYFLLHTALFFLNSRRSGRIIKTLLLISFLWLYAVLTGLSPPVMRSAAMFSFVEGAKLFRRDTHILNTLSASVFLLLFINPWFLLDAGFELSYLSVAGIIGIHPVLTQFAQPQSWLGQKIGPLLSVSLAAQAATFPLGLYYFHQFPVYFLLTNLVVIPLSSAVIYVGLSLLAVHLVPGLGIALSYTYMGLLKALNGCVFFFSSLPGASLNGIYITLPETAALYLLVVMFLRYLMHKTSPYLHHLLWVMLMYTGWQCVCVYQAQRVKRIIIYSVPHHVAVDLCSGRLCQSFQDSGLIHNPETQHFFLLPTRRLFRLRMDVKTERLNGLNILTWQGRKILICQGLQSLPPRILKTDYLIAGQGADLFGQIRDR
ncbi:MAG TPA: ComEC/Rec2 family competence protein, partial [Bacteroidia bacterium]|nr:ComEC/Rec2 family competence protein [Bacteroidia bacterium]